MPLSFNRARIKGISEPRLVHGGIVNHGNVAWTGIVDFRLFLLLQILIRDKPDVTLARSQLHVLTASRWFADNG